MDENSGWLSSLGDSVHFNGKRKLLVIACAFVLTISNTLTSTANAVTAKVVPMCVDPVLKYSGMKKLTQVQVYDLLRLTGFKGHSLKIAWAVAMKETHGNPLAHNYNPRTGDNSYGMFQINLYGALKDRVSQYKLASASALYDPVTNAKIAFQMTSGGRNWGSWGVGSNSYNGGVSTGVVQYWLKAVPSV
jgi:hypothetical protein